ncbi:MAG TPA: RluA family pseudouridine synthase [Sphingomonadaceae bacterium]|nr:RluA family pseudouridine synthase [Sphingomonadaceae bacterium]
MKPADEVRQFTVGADDDDIRLDRWFKRHLPQVGFATVSRWARTGQIRVDGKRAKPEDRLSAGQKLRVPPGGEPTAKGPPQRRELSEEEIARAEAMVITQDRSAIVLNKPPGLATQGGTKMKDHVDGLLDAFVRGDEARPRLVHRLDKDTSGVLLVARTPGSAAFFSKRFSGRSAKKVYWALVVGVPDVLEGTIEAPIAKQPGTGGEKMHVDEENGQPARTRYRVVDRAAKRACWVELQPLTGRTHQLRVHMAAIGHPIVGDGKYGGQDAFLTGSISRKMHLHARRLLIDHPDGGKLDATAELPEHFANSMAQLGFDLTLSDAMPDDGPPPPTRTDQKQAAKAHAKQFRKERRGERRKRSAPASPPARKGKPAAGAKPGAKPTGKPGPKPGGRPGARPGGKPAAKFSPPRGRK